MDDTLSRLFRVALVMAVLAGLLALAVLSGRGQNSLPAVIQPVASADEARLIPTPTLLPEEEPEEILIQEALPTLRPAIAVRSQATPTPRRVVKVNAADRIVAIGDSVMLGAAGDISQLVDGVIIDAAYGRQVDGAIEVLRARRAAGLLGNTVIIQIGNNGTFETAQFDEMMALMKGVRRVIFITLKVPRQWQEANNGVIADGASRYPNIELIDWYGVSIGRPEFFYEDGVHIRPEGAQAYAEMIAGYLATR
jgi:hypothetical protein